MPPKVNVSGTIEALRARFAEISDEFQTSQVDNFNETLPDDADLRARELENNWRECQSLYYQLYEKVPEEQRVALPFFRDQEYRRVKEEYRQALLALNRVRQSSVASNNTSRQDNGPCCRRGMKSPDC